VANDVHEEDVLGSPRKMEAAVSSRIAGIGERSRIGKGQ
jgi:hypothetical protein